jgi:RNA polymerase sigma factor (sigma-70 family)
VEASALKHAGVAGLRGQSSLLRLQSDERLVTLVRRGSPAAFEALVARYQSRLLAFCRHMLVSREDAEDVLQEVFAAAFNAILADERDINVRPWLYRIARNRSLNHLRRVQAIGVDSMDIHLSEGGITTADKVHRREDFRLLIADVQTLPETQRTALLLREIDALSYDQIAEAMDTTVPSVKSLLVRARMSLAEAAEARKLSCDQVRVELAEVSEGIRRMTAPVRRHLRGCERCSTFRAQLKQTNKALAAVFPVGPMILLKKLALAHFGTTAAGGATVAGTAAGGAAAGGAAGGAVSVGLSTLAGKTAAGLAAAAIVTAGAVEVKRVATDRPAAPPVAAQPPGPGVEPIAAPIRFASPPVASAKVQRAAAPAPAASTTSAGAAKASAGDDAEANATPSTEQPGAAAEEARLAQASGERPVEPAAPRALDAPPVAVGEASPPAGGRVQQDGDTATLPAQRDVSRDSGGATAPPEPEPVPEPVPMGSGGPPPAGQAPAGEGSGPVPPPPPPGGAAPQALPAPVAP